MDDRTAIFTICSNNYLAQAEVFFETARRFHPDADLVLGLADVRAAVPYPDGVAVIAAESLDIPDFRNVAFAYDIMEFNTAIKPFMFLKLFGAGYARVLYFDPDIMLFRRLDDVLETLDRGASFVLTPHLCSPPGPGAPRDEADVMRTGAYNLGFLASSRRAETEPLLRWWARKLRHECVNEQTNGIFVDQKFMDLLPGFADHARVSRDPTLNVAYWNIAGRDLRRAGDGWTVDGRPLGFFHFSGFDPDRPEVLSKHAPDAAVADGLGVLLRLYAGGMVAGRRPGAAPAYGYGRFASGTPVPDAVRRLFRDWHEGWMGDPFASFEDYPGLAFRDAAVGASGEVVSRIMGHVHARSDVLKGHFNLAIPAQVSAYARWFGDEAGRLGLPDAMWRSTGREV